MEHSSEPLVSIIIPCYNQGRFLKEAIDSALSQTYRQVEIIVVDDGSTDNTPDVAQGYRERIRYIRRKNGGRAVARNTGILEAHGEFLLFLDSDDYLMTDMLGRHMEVARRSSKEAVFHGGWREVNETGQVMFETGPLPLDADPFHTQLAGLSPLIHCVTVRRMAFARVGLFDERLPQRMDWDMWLRLAAAGYRFVGVPGSISVYRHHSESVSLKHPDLKAKWGLAVLERSKTYHAGCPTCRDIIAARVPVLRRMTLFPVLNDLAGYRARGEIWQGASKAFALSLHNPYLGRLVLLSAFGHLRHELSLRLPFMQKLYRRFRLKERIRGARAS